MDIKQRLFLSYFVYAFFCVIVVTSLFNIGHLSVLYKYNNVRSIAIHELHLLVHENEQGQGYLKDIDRIEEKVLLIREESNKCLDTITPYYKSLLRVMSIYGIYEICQLDLTTTNQLLAYLKMHRQDELNADALYMQLMQASDDLMDNARDFILPVDQAIRFLLVMMASLIIILSIGGFLFIHYSVKFFRERFFSLFNNNLVEVHVLDAATFSYIDANDKSLSNLGYKREDLPALSIYDVLFGMDRTAWAEYVAPLKSGEKKFVVFQTRFKRKDDSVYVVELRLEKGVYKGQKVFYCLVTDVSDRYEAESLLKRALEEVSAVQDLLSEGLITVTENGKIESWNKAAERIFGYEKEDILNRSVQNVLPDLKTALEGHLFEDMAQMENYTTGTNGLRRDGEEFPLVMSFRRLKTSYGNKYLCVVNESHSPQEISRELQQTALDLTYQKEQLEMAKKKAESANQSKSEFIANISHELRSPLNGIIGMTSYLLSTKLESRQISSLETIKSASNLLLDLIEDLLDLSKIEAGQMSLKGLPFDICDTIEDLASLCAVDHKQKPIDLILDWPPDIPRNLIGDVNKLRQIVNNLLTNAFKFTEQGHIRVSVRLEDSGEHKNRHSYYIRVEDTGIGIPENKLAMVFDDFVQLDNTTTKSHRGTGLGLSISRKLAQIMGGEMGVESEEGRGSTFWLRVPFDADPHLTAGRVFMPWKRFTIPSLNILIWDESAGLGASLIEEIRQKGHISTLVKSVSESIQALEKNKFDQMFIVARSAKRSEAQTGEEIQKCVKKIHKQEPELPVIYLAPNSIRLEDAATSLKDVLQGYLTLPINPDELEAMIKAVWKWKGEVDTRQIVTRHSLKNVSDEAIAAKDYKGTHVLIAEDAEANRKVMAYILEQFGCHTDFAADGQEALWKVMEQDFQLVFMDCRMPVVDGYEAVQKIRVYEKENEKDHIPIVAITANAMEGDRDYCLSIGMDDYVAKPVDREKIRSVLAKWVILPESMNGGGEYGPQNDVSAEKQTEKKEISLQPQNFDDEFDTSFLDMILESGVDQATTLFDEFVVQVEIELQTIDREYESGNFKTVRDTAHRVKSLLAQLGLLELSDMAQTLEDLVDVGKAKEAMLIKQDLDERFASSKILMSLYLDHKKEKDGDDNPQDTLDEV